MYAVVGTLLTVLVVLYFTVVVLATRKPNPPAWIGYNAVHEFVAISSVSLASFGVGLVAESIVFIKEQPLTPMDAVLTALVLVVFAAVWKRLRVKTKLAEYAGQKENAAHASALLSRPSFVLDTARTSPGLGTATPEDPDSPTRPRTPHLPKKAA